MMFYIMPYYEKYKKYKSKYLNLKDLYRATNGDLARSQKGIQVWHDYKFVIVHGALDFITLKTILEDGFIRPGKDVDPKFWKLHGSMEAANFIYANIYFNDLKNLPLTILYSFVLHPKILYDFDIVFNQSWKVEPTDDSIRINKSDSEQIKNNKIRKIKKSIADSEGSFLPEIMRHEILISDKISVKDYVLGITCESKHVKEIEKIIIDKEYKFKVLTKNEIPELSLQQYIKI
jgi:hypothetical protein